MRVCVCVFSRIRLSADTLDYSLPGSSVHGIFQARMNSGVGFHFLLQGIFLTQGSERRLLCLLRWQANSFTTELHGKSRCTVQCFDVLIHYEINTLCIVTIWSYLGCSGLMFVFKPFWVYLFQMVYVFQSLRRVQLFVTPWIAARQASLSFSITQSLLNLMAIESVMPSNHFILCIPLPSIFPSVRVCSN